MATLGRYELKERLGDGGFAVVYRASDPALQREVAVKLLRSEWAEVPEMHQRFLAEARALARLHHPGIVTVFDVGEADRGPFFAMELVAGRTLQSRVLPERPLPLQEVVRLLGQLGAAVDYLHRGGLVHRDIKPGNIMLDPLNPLPDGSERVVLMDLGIVYLLSAAQGGLTRTLGTPHYMAPEQVRGQGVGTATDIYALGVLVYHLLAGRPPFEGDTAEVMHKQVYEPVPDLQTYRPGLPQEVYAAVAASLAKEPQQRPPSARAFLEALQGMPATALVIAAPVPDRRVVTAPTDTTPPVIEEVARGHRDVDAPVAARNSSEGQPREPQERIKKPTRTFLHRHRLPALVGSLVLAVALVSVIVAGLLLRGSTARAATLAGSGNAGFADGPGATAQFDFPNDIAVDGAGNVYVADTGNHRIRKITP